MTNAIQKTAAKLRRAAEQGKIRALETVWSPEDTTADARYQIRTRTGETQILLHREVAGFLAGLAVTE